MRVHIIVTRVDTFLGGSATHYIVESVTTSKGSPCQQPCFALSLRASGMPVVLDIIIATLIWQVFAISEDRVQQTQDIPNKYNNDSKSNIYLTRPEALCLYDEQLEHGCNLNPGSRTPSATVVDSTALAGIHSQFQLGSFAKLSFPHGSIGERKPSIATPSFTVTFKHTCIRSAGDMTA
eukprot:546239-Amphidinium_carterae.1